MQLNNCQFSFFIKFLFGICVLSQNISCKKYLEEKPVNTVNVPTTLTDIQALLDDAGLMNQNLTPCYGEVSTDNYFLLQNTYDGRQFHEKEAYKFIPFIYIFDNDWSKSYAPVFNSNYCLEMIEKIPITIQNEEAWKNVKGSCLFYRAYSFLNLAWTYSRSYDEISADTDLGIVLRLGSDFNVSSERASVRETYDRIINDAKESISYLPLAALHRHRPSRPAAYGLLARAYLSMRKYDSAYKYSNLYLGIKNELIDCNVPNTTDFATTSASFPFKVTNRELTFYTEMNSSFITIASFARAKIDTLLYASYTSSDLRKAAFFQENPSGSGYFRFKGSYTGVTLHFTGIATDEMYLIKAECLARGWDGTSPDKDAAMTVLNTLLFKRHNNTFTGLVATDAANALDIILAERRKELLFRGLRWMDIKRLNKEGRNIIITRVISGQTYTLQPNANYYALPLPTDIIQLTGMPQNPYP